jgi:hypothetical protein
MKTILTTILLTTGLCLSITITTKAQGCVAIRGGVNMCTMNQHQDNTADTKKWNLNINNRYFRSFRHFVGSEEQKHRIEQGTQVINYTYSADITLGYSINPRWSVAFNLPIIANHRSSLYEHTTKARYSTSSFGVGDARLSVYRWLTDPAKATAFRLQAGLGIKLATGDYRYQDKFHNTDTSTVLGPVDQSIQLGDGGTGFTGELNAFYDFNKKANLYFTGYYLLNPREHNGVSTARGRTPSATSIAYGSDVMSVPDQYMVRFGMNYMIHKFTVSAGVRHECLPARDLVGGSAGFRRPGYVTSAEPGLAWTTGKATIYATVPVAIKRNRIQSNADKIRTNITGIYAKGDAAFADYAVNVGMQVHF